MRQFLKKILPEGIPSFAAPLYTFGSARMFEPHYCAIAGEVDLPDNAVLLDVGTGPGVLPIKIAVRFPNAKCIGIDLSEKMIRIADGKKDGTKNVEFRVMNASQLLFNSNSLDMVISTGSMHHWHDPVSILNEIYRCLKPGAEAWIYDGYADATDEAIRKNLKRFLGVLPTCWMARRIMGIHGFSLQEYDTKIKIMIARTAFATGVFEVKGVMMRIRLQKPVV